MRLPCSADAVELGQFSLQAWPSNASRGVLGGELDVERRRQDEACAVFGAWDDEQDAGKALKPGVLIRRMMVSDGIEKPARYFEGDINASCRQRVWTEGRWQ